MEQMSMHHEAAYERLYRWTQSLIFLKFILTLSIPFLSFDSIYSYFILDECRLMCNDSVEVSDFMSTAMFVLSNRPILFK